MLSLPGLANRDQSLYQVPMKATHVGDSQSEADVIHRGKRVGVCHGCRDWGSRGLRRRAIARAGEAVGDANQTRRLLALAAIYDGGSRTEAAKLGGVGLQTVRDWVLAFNAEGPAGLVNGKAPGNAPLLTQAHPAGAAGDRRERPDPGGSRRRALAADRPGAMGLRGIPHLDQQADAEPRIARPGVAQAVGPAPASRPGRRSHGGVQKNFAASLDEIAKRDAAGKPIEIWFQDEARIGQKNKITRRWARRGTRPSAPRDQRTRSTYIFGAICPAQGTAAGLILPRCNTAAMALHLTEISRTVTPGAHAVLLLDQAGWHLSDKLDIPANITLMPLPPKSPELNPVENIWQARGGFAGVGPARFLENSLEASILHNSA